jgi:hypothetical protein
MIREQKTCGSCSRFDPLCGFHKYSRTRPTRPVCADCSAIRLRLYNQSIRNKCIELLGAKCDICGITEREFLTVDHVDGDGSIERQSKHPDQIKKFILKNPECRSRYRILCRNCNDEIEMTRPKHSSSTRRNENRRIKSIEIRLEVINFLGGICKCCEDTGIFRLTVDHINNDGSSCLGPRGGADLYKLILDKKIDMSLFQLLCWNCNFSKYLGGGVCVHQRKIEVGY